MLSAKFSTQFGQGPLQSTTTASLYSVSCNNAASMAFQQVTIDREVAAFTYRSPRIWQFPKTDRRLEIEKERAKYQGHQNWNTKQPRECGKAQGPPSNMDREGQKAFVLLHFQRSSTCHLPSFKPAFGTHLGLNVSKRDHSRSRSHIHRTTSAS